MKAIKYLPLLIFTFLLTSCSNVLIEETYEISWWMTAIFFFFWLFFSNPYITALIVGDAYTNGWNDPEERKLHIRMAANSVFAFPIMYLVSLLLGTFLYWLYSYVISIIVGYILASLICSKIDPFCEKYYTITKCLWYIQVIVVVFSIIISL